MRYESFVVAYDLLLYQPAAAVGEKIRKTCLPSADPSSSSCKCAFPFFALPVLRVSAIGSGLSLSLLYSC
jgi:hypothetical protein